MFSLIMLLLKMIFFPITIIYYIYRVCGFFIGTIISVTIFMLCFAGCIGFIQSVVNNSAPMTKHYHQLQKKDQKHLLDMTKISCLSYVNNREAFMGLKKELAQEGYIVTENIKINDKGLTYVSLKQGNSIYISFRGSTKKEDFIDDGIIIITKELQHMGRFVNAKDIVEKFLKEYPDKNIILVGHSLGGSVVQYVLKHNKSERLKGYTVNPFALPGDVSLTTDARLTDIIHEADIAQTVLLKSRVIGIQRILVRGRFYKKNGQWIPEFDLISSPLQHKLSSLLPNMQEQYTGSYRPPDAQFRSAKESRSLSELLDE